MKRITPEECFEELVLKSMDFKIRNVHLDKGIHFVLYFLYLNKDVEICSGDLSKKMNVSSARIAALLNDLESKGWAYRDKSDSDSRKTIIKITKEGESEIVEKRKKACLLLRHIIDEVGEEDIRKFIDTSKKIKTIVERNFSYEKDF